MAKEYLAGGNAGATEEGLRALAVPFFHHEFVRQARPVPFTCRHAPQVAAYLDFISMTCLVCVEYVLGHSRQLLVDQPQGPNSIYPDVSASVQAATLALHNPQKQAAILALLGQLAGSGFVSANQLIKVVIGLQTSVAGLLGPHHGSSACSLAMSIITSELLANLV